MRKVFYYASWVVLLSFMFIMAYGATAKHGLGPLILGVVLVASVFGIINGRED